MKTLAMFNNKGGVGKTTIVLNVAYTLGKAGKKTLVIDCDEQQNTFRFFADNPGNSDIQPTRYDNISVAMYSDGIADTDEYDLAIFDMPPAVNDKSTVILQQCNHVFIPLEVGAFSLQGLTKVTNLVNECGIPFSCFISKFERKNPADGKFREMLKAELGDKLLSVIIPKSNVIKNSQNYRVTAPEYLGNSSASLSLGDLTEEILEIMERTDEQ